ncbi:MAG: elongation factor P [Candidatus Moranbacteria bacterium CG_4_9_14_3_um_filter_45_14]|nr:MAG: elongation factor P [Candidatus Moranbacteria bacterium CG2_30_45_14]PJA85739.1 MAG: elongation factor P [Candidatus Moranbacteria bacterium CG_4_9_14_3_um_filter_45_14]
MLNMTDIKTGKKIIWNNEPYVVLEYLHSKIGRGGAVMRTKLKNLLSGVIIDYTFQGAEKVEETEISKSHAQYLYHEGDDYHFMDTVSFDQFSLSKEVLGDTTMYLVEGTEISVLNWNGRPINVDPPVKVTLTVTDAPPGIKGDTASGGGKVVTLETGLQITAPLFIKVDDRVIVNTEKGTYVSRA